MNFNLAKYLASYGTASQLPESERPEVAFAGRSNVGKSSLLNKLMFRKGLAKVSSQPGKTATINFYEVDDAHLVDLPGYGFAKVSKAEKKRWADLIDGYFEGDRRFALVVSLIDIRHDPSALDRNMVAFLQESGLPFAIALTKADKLSNQKALAQRKAICKALGVKARRDGGPDDAVPVVLTSAENGRGVEELRELIAKACEEA